MGFEPPNKTSACAKSGGDGKKPDLNEKIPLSRAKNQMKLDGCGSYITRFPHLLICR